MSDLLEHELREALAERAAAITPAASARLRSADYRARTRRAPSRRALGTLGFGGVVAAGVAAVLLGSSAAPAFAGWTAHPTLPRPGQLADAIQRCGSSAGTPILADTRGPYTASIYADGSTCLEGNGITIASGGGGSGTTDIPAGTIELNGAGEADSSGHALTMVDGPIGAGVTAVSITRSDGTTVRATVEHGWYLAWWPGRERAITAEVATAHGNATQAFPALPSQSGPNCPTGAQCSSGYGFGSARGRARSTAIRAAGSASGH